MHTTQTFGTPVPQHFSGVSVDYGHTPVMARRAIELLTPALTGPDAVYLDGTLGAGGHSELVLRTFPQVQVIGVDRDADAIAIATERLASFGSRFAAIHSEYHEVGQVLAQAGVDTVDGALFDLGVSSMQLDRADRGFAYRVDAPLDMRMNAADTRTAADILNTYSHGDLARVLREYGEERFAGRIASAVIAEREKQPFTTSGRFVELLYRAIPAATRRTGGHPAKRAFQALRIEVNGELESLSDAVPATMSALAVGGRLVVMSYQSLEDRIVKRLFTEASVSTSPPGLPVDLPGTEPEFDVLTRGAERADDEEITINPRSAPVRTRAIARIRAAATPTRSER